MVARTSPVQHNFNPFSDCIISFSDIRLFIYHLRIHTTKRTEIMWWLVPCQSNIISIPLVTAFMVSMEQCYNLYLHIFASTALFTPLPMILKSPCYNFSVSHMFFYSFNGSMIAVCHLLRQNRAEACTNDISALYTIH